ncbi:MAG TPA: hypothetical protein VJT75_04095 [Thermoleophilaceae bacterium]|nr:hypothetical protein [Thermoleophilaceae bacterium]
MDDRRFRARSDGTHRLFDDADAARRFQRRMREVAPSGAHGRPAIHYDESGYPIEDRTSLADRVRRLITG